MVVIHDVTAGAIYNNSLVTYHEPVLLYDDHHYATANKQRVAIIVAHELLPSGLVNLYQGVVETPQ